MLWMLILLNSACISSFAIYFCFLYRFLSLNWWSSRSSIHWILQVEHTYFWIGISNTIFFNGIQILRSFYFIFSLFFFFIIWLKRWYHHEFAETSFESRIFNFYQINAHDYDWQTWRVYRAFNIDSPKYFASGVY